MPEKPNTARISLAPVLFVLLLFLLLSLLSVSVIIAGGSVYEAVSENMEENYSRRVTFSYLSTKIRQNDAFGRISAAQKDGTQMIAIKENFAGEEFVTYIYYHDGYLRELFIEIIDGGVMDFELSWGKRIIPAENFTFYFEEETGKIKMSLTDKDKNTQSAEVYIRSAGSWS
jgi:hypothetical protein